MKLMVILYLWQALSYGGHDTKMGWVDRGLYESVAACEEAVRQLGVKPNQYRCIKQGEV